HTISGTIVGGEMKKERVLLKLRRSPHRYFRAHDLLDVLHERGPLTAFVTERMHDDVILLAINVEIVLRPIRRHLCRRVDHFVPVWKLPFSLAGVIQATIYDFPTGRRLDRQFYWIRFMAHDVHEDGAAVVVGVSGV